MSYDTQRPHIASYVIFKNEEGKVAFVLRSNTSWMNNFYSLPSGKIETDESALKAAIREAKEEVGVSIKEKDLRHLLTTHRKNEGDHAPEWIDIYFEASAWQGELYNAEPEMHSKLEWLDPDNLPNNTVDNVKADFRAIKEGRTYNEFGW